MNGSKRQAKRRNISTHSLKGFHHYVGRSKMTRRLVNRRDRAAAKRFLRP